MTNFLLDKEIFCDQVIRNQETMFRTAKAILHQDEDAEDAVQEAICAALDCQPGDILEFVPDEEAEP